MNKTARVVVIGGGIAGCSTLYHLVESGWTDVMLLERDELTSGTTWHSAAQVTSFGTNQTMIGLKRHSIALYRNLAVDPDHPVNYNHGDGGIRLAGNREQMDGYHHFTSMAHGMGVELEVIDAHECQLRNPLITTDGLLGGLWDPHDGHIEPSQLCHSLVRRSRIAGAVIMTHCPVTDLEYNPSSNEWNVTTPDGIISCEIIVNAAGYRCNEVAAMMGIRLPVTSIEHQYIITEPMPEVQSVPHRIPLVRCPIDDFYLRQEQTGLLVGFYEQDCRPWGTGGIDPAFTSALCQDDLERILPVFERAARRVPSLTTAGIRNIINGPITYTADGLPLVGRIPGLRNAYCATGLRAGIGEGGGHGWLLAEMIVNGEASLDTWCLDPARFGGYADQDYTIARAVEDYRNEFRFHLPNERRPAGKSARTTGLTSLHLDSNAHLEAINGWERPMLFPDDGKSSLPQSYRRSSLHDQTCSEVMHVQNHVGMTEISGFSRISISGPGTWDWLNGLSPSRIPRQPGRTGLCYFLNQHGNLKCEAVVANLGNRFWYISAAAAETHDLDWLQSHLPEDGSVQLDPITEDYQAIVAAGPRSRDVMTKAFGECCSIDNLPWKSVTTTMEDTIIVNLSYTGELSFEIHTPAARLRDVWDMVSDSGKDFRIRPFGTYAIESMRMEKALGHWKAEWITEFNPFECGLHGFVDTGKKFFGRDGLLTSLESGLLHRLCLFSIDTDIAHAQPGASIRSSDAPVGTVTSGNFGYRTDTNLAMGFIKSDYADNAPPMTVDILGIRHTMTLLADPPYDPNWSRVSCR